MVVENSQLQAQGQALEGNGGLGELDALYTADAVGFIQNDPSAQINKAVTQREKAIINLNSKLKTTK